MLTESEKRAAALAVTRFGVDRDRVQAISRTVQEAQAKGQPADLLTALVEHQLLTTDQAGELRLALAATQVDTRAAIPFANGGVKRSAPSPELRRLGDYYLLRRLGEGGMGSVYLAYREGEERQVAIKVLADALAANPAYVKRFYREARSAAQLNHPNLVRGLGAYQDPASRKHYLVMEYVDGPSALGLLNRLGRLPVADVVHIALEMARALEHAHSRNIIHRDIKPDNILLTQSGVAKLADLGLARRTDEVSNLTGSQSSFGTPLYMPYEQALNARKADGRSDIFALGATLYHLLTGEVPFTGSHAIELAEKKSKGDFISVRTRNPEVPEALERILHKMLAPSPRRRYQMASQLIVDLERTNLAADVPSFVDPEVALQDPVVRARLEAPTLPTQPDLKALASHSPRIVQRPNSPPAAGKYGAKAWWIGLGVGLVIGAAALIYYALAS
jgi:serine/threonine-protein kinase